MNWLGFFFWWSCSRAVRCQATLKKNSCQERTCQIILLHVLQVASLWSSNLLYYRDSNCQCVYYCVVGTAAAANNWKKVQFSKRVLTGHCVVCSSRKWTGLQYFHCLISSSWSRGGDTASFNMLHLFLGLKSLVKVSRYHTDGSVFRLHYRVTVMALLAFTFIVTTRQYIGSPIMCVHTKEIPKDVLNTYCWIHPTYTLSSAHWKRVGIDVPHPGVDKTRDERDKKHVKYYQWVGFCLFFQVRNFPPFFSVVLITWSACHPIQ